MTQLLGTYRSRIKAPPELEGPVTFRETKAFISLDSSFGIRWQTNPCCHYLAAFQIAWETHTYVNTILVGDDLDVGDINLHGATLTAILQF